MSIQAIRQISNCLLVCLVLLTAPASPAPASAASGFEEANAANQRGDFDAAIQHLSEVISSGGLGSLDLAQAHRQRGAAYFGRGMYRLGRNEHTLIADGHRDIGQAIADYDAAISLSPSDADAFNGRGLAYCNKTPGYFQQATADFDTAIRLKPDFAEAYLNRGKCGRGGDAIADFSEVIRLEPRSPVGIEARVLRANLLRIKGNLNAAIADYSDVIRLVPDHWGALEGRGWTYRRKGQFTEAIADFSSVIRLSIETVADFGKDGDPGKLNDAILLYSRAIEDKDECLEFSGYRNSPPDPKWPELVPAAKVFEAIMSREPIDARINRGIAHYHLGELGPAIEDLSGVIGRVPPARFEAIPIRAASQAVVAAYSSRAAAYRDRGELDQALADYDDALKAWGSSGRAAYPDAAIFYGRGLTLLRQGDFANAIGGFDEAIRAERDYAPAYANRGIAKLYAGRPGAEEDLADALRLVPSNPYWVLWLNLARVRAGADGRAEFARHAAKLDQGRWPWPVIALRLGTLSADHMRAASATFADVGGIYACEAEFYAGTFELEAGRTAEAKQRLEAAANSCAADANERAFARAELNRLIP